MSNFPATEKQLAFIDRLAAERAYTNIPASLTSREASVLINTLLAIPARKLANPVTQPGIYRTAAGEVYKVQESKGSGNLYAKKLTPINGDRLSEAGAVVSWTFEYAPGAVKFLTPADRLTLDAAKAFGLQFGVCIVCGKTLTDAKSVAAGIGPVCAKRV